MPLIINNDPTLPTSYQGDDHPLIKVDRDCVHCPLGKVRVARNQRAAAEEGNNDCSLVVPGAGPDDLNNVKLICVSDFAGHYEAASGIPFFDTHQDKGDRHKNGLVRDYNAGCYLRKSLMDLFGLNSYTQCWLTNAIKCDPGKRKPVFTNIKDCSLRWLKGELELLDQHVPAAPILILGGVAFDAVKYLYRGQANLTSLSASRRRTDIRLGKHPAVFTLNPAKPARCAPRIETEVRYNNGVTRIKRNEWIPETLALPGSPTYSFRQDLACLLPFLNSQSKT